MIPMSRAMLLTILLLGTCRDVPPDSGRSRSNATVPPRETAHLADEGRLTEPLSSRGPRQRRDEPAESVFAHPWTDASEHESVASRFPPPAGCSRIDVGRDGFGAWLRGLPLRPGRPDVLLHDGRKKANQNAHAAVLLVDVGKRDLQQCADAVIRLRAEYLYAAGRRDEIQFRFTSGDAAAWSRWRSGDRPTIRGNAVRWSRKAMPDASYRSFRKYLVVVFAYAGSLSLSRELQSVDDPARVEPGHVFIQGGLPGHAVIVLDVVENEAGARMFLLAQSYMPAQEIHVLRNPTRPDSPWYHAKSRGPLPTPEWRFRYSDLKRFPPVERERSP